MTGRLGSVIDIVSDAGILIKRVRYDNMGKQTAVYNNPSFSNFFDDHGYTGRETDAVTGLQYNRERYYDPYVGRWISKDTWASRQGMPTCTAM